MKAGFCLALLLNFSSAGAVPAQTQMLQPSAKFIEVENGLMEPLDLKSRVLIFGKDDLARCGLKLQREALTMNYSCTLPLDVTARVSRLQKVVTAKTIESEFGGSKRKVFVNVADDARTITYSTGFDATGIDFQIHKFNDDLFSVFNKVAQLVIADAMIKQPVRMEVLESRDRTPKPAKNLIKAVVRADQR